MVAWQRSELTDVTAKVVIYEVFIEGRLEATKHLARSVHESLLRAKVRGIPIANDLESLECVHIRIQGTGSRPTVQGYSQAGRVPGRPVLTIVLVCGTVSAVPLQLVASLAYCILLALARESSVDPRPSQSSTNRVLLLPAATEASVNANQTYKLIQLSLSESLLGSKVIGFIGQHL